MSALGDTPCRGFGARGTGYFAPACGLLADIVKSLAFSIPGGQKMPNMSTVAIAVSYRLYEIIDIKENMFIYVDTYRTASGRFDKFEGLYRSQRGHLRQFWLLLKR